VTGEASDYEIADDGSFMAPLEVAYPYSRTLGGSLSRFFTGLRDHRIEGTKGSDGRVYAPPAEFDPVTGAPCTDWVTVGEAGVVTTWSWDPVAGCAWALVRLDGADVPMLHRVDAGDPSAMSTGLRVRARWRSERSGSITDIEAFVPVDQPLMADQPAGTDRS
jgi:uncharacterized protein